MIKFTVVPLVSPLSSCLKSDWTPIVKRNRDTLASVTVLVSGRFFLTRAPTPTSFSEVLNPAIKSCT